MLDLAWISSDWHAPIHQARTASNHPQSEKGLGAKQKHFFVTQLKTNKPFYPAQPDVLPYCCPKLPLRLLPSHERAELRKFERDRKKKRAVERASERVGKGIGEGEEAPGVAKNMS